MRFIWLLGAFACVANAENHTLTLQQAIDRGMTQNPEVMMARMDEVRASESIRVAKDPFSPRIGGGSGLAYSYGFPLSIEGSAPSIFQAKAEQYLYNRPQSWAVAQAKESARGAGYATGEKRDEIVYRVASMFVDVQRAGKLADAISKEVESLQKIYDTIDARVQLGRELPVARSEAHVNLLRAQQRLMSLQSDQEYGQHNLAATLGFGASDTVQPVTAEDAPLPIPQTEEAAVKTALDSSKELKRLESNYEAKNFEIKSNKAQRLPRVDLVAQYALLSQFSHYDQYFLKFQRNNGEIGASIQIPLLLGPAVKAQVMQAESDQQKIRAQILAERNRITLDVHQGFQDLIKANVSNQLAKAEVDLAHEQLSVLLAQMNEGRAGLAQVEQARSTENEKWIAFYDAQFTDMKARLNILRATGELTAALR